MPSTAPVLAPAIAAYIAAANARDSSAVTSFFAEDATVFDEGRQRVGTRDIAHWMADCAQRYQPRLQVQAVQQRTGKVLLDNLVWGAFPGSPLALRYVFRLDPQGKICRLDISL